MYEQMLDVGACFVDFGGFLLFGTLVVLLRKTGPGAKMLGGREHGHIHSDFRDNTDCGKRLDTWHRHNKIELWNILFRNGKNKRVQIGFAEFEAFHVRMDNAELFACSTHNSPSTAKRSSSSVAFMPLARKPEKSVIFLCVVFQ